MSEGGRQETRPTGLDVVLDRIRAYPGVCPADLRYFLPRIDVGAVLEELLDQGRVRFDEAAGVHVVDDVDDDVEDLAEREVAP